MKDYCRVYSPYFIFMSRAESEQSLPVSISLNAELSTSSSPSPHWVDISGVGFGALSNALVGVHFKITSTACRFRERHLSRLPRTHLQVRYNQPRLLIQLFYACPNKSMKTLRWPSTQSIISSSYYHGLPIKVLRNNPLPHLLSLTRPTLTHPAITYNDQFDLSPRQCDVHLS